MNKKYKTIGLMSGTSLDGLDIAYCEFEKINGQWQYKLLHGKTIPYQADIIHRLQQAPFDSGLNLHKTHQWFGQWCAEQVNQFIHQFSLSPHFIASHGHTIFHHPAEAYTLQIGNGAVLYAHTQVPVICDFRSVDVATGGQGAPLVPIGDKYLFHAYDLCLNIGGIANISCTNSTQPAVAFDICAANIVLNQWIKYYNPNYQFDIDGKVAKSGNVNDSLLHQLNAIEYYQVAAPKSIGREWVEQSVEPILNQYQHYQPADILCTYTIHIAMQIAQSSTQLIATNHKAKMLITGGGAFNVYLIDQIQRYLPSNIQIGVAEKSIIEYKEALIFAFLGVLRIENQANSLSTITGAKYDTLGGAVYGNVLIE
jgi:anhydro-N-acetylmuramic acid kinase